MDSPVILITGAGKGIGKAIVEMLIERAASKKTQSQQPQLVLTSRTLSDLSALDQKAKDQGLKCEILAMELTEAPARAIAFTREKFGRLDQLIHSAGVGRFGNFLDLTPEDLQFTLKTNIEATFLLLQAAYRQILNQPAQVQSKKHRGDIVCISSLASEKAFDQSAIYCMSKFAQRGLLQVMKNYGHQDGIRIMEVKPGATLTPMWGESAPAEKMMLPEDIAQIILDALALNPRASVEDILVRPLHGDL